MVLRRLCKHEMGTRSRRLWIGLVGLGVCVVLLVAGFYWQENPACAGLLQPELLPNADFSLDQDQDDFPDGWNAKVKGPARLAAAGDYTVTGSGRSIQLMGIGNTLETPVVPITPNSHYCFIAQALADQAPAPPRLRLHFQWLDSEGRLRAEDATAWQVVNTPASGAWAMIQGGFQAPAEASTLRVVLQPASDDRIYLDEAHLRRGGRSTPGQRTVATKPQGQVEIRVRPWPSGRRAAVSFSFDWETTMGGLVHSRSVEDLSADHDPLLRGLRMRQGVTETLALFEPYGIRATYYANGYNFLLGNREQRRFLNNPTYGWATVENRWRLDWSQRPWFAPDPYTDYKDTASAGAAWYFGDLIPRLRAAEQDIQSHTFSHFYGAFASLREWETDLAAWNALAAEQGVPRAKSLAFPWSSSGGMSYAAWDTLEQAGITSVTRLSDQAQFQLFDYRNEVPVAPRCLPVPGHETILACPDVYLTPGKREAQAIQAIDAALEGEGAVDIWAHTEEVTSPEQIATWQRVLTYATSRAELWIAPLAELTAWQQAIEQVTLRVTRPDVDDAPGWTYHLAVTNPGSQRLEGVTIAVPAVVQRVTGGQDRALLPTVVITSTGGQSLLTLSLEPGQQLALDVWTN